MRTYLHTPINVNNTVVIATDIVIFCTRWGCTRFGYQLKISDINYVIVIKGIKVEVDNTVLIIE